MTTRCLPWLLALAIAALAAVACDNGPHPVGATCRRAADCAGSICITETGRVDWDQAEVEAGDDAELLHHIPDSTFFRGMCTGQCDGGRCGRFERCIAADGMFSPMCVPVCNDDIPCRPRYRCRELGTGPDDPFGVCWPIDSASRPRRTDEETGPNTVNQGRAGAACKVSSHCDAFLPCLHRLDPRRPDSIEFPAGFCARSCSAADRCEEHADARCATIANALRGESINLCLKPCSNSNECRKQYQCVQLGAFEPLRGVCWPERAAALPEPLP